MIEVKTQWIREQQFEGASSGGHRILIDADKKAAASPMELVLLGLCSCTASDVVNILGKKREPLASLEIRAQAERAPSPPAVYTEIRLTYRVGGKVTRKAVEDAVRLSEEKYCSVAAMLRKTAKIRYVIEYSEA
jgi:putative redox protein